MASAIWDALNTCFDLRRDKQYGQNSLSWNMLDHGNGRQLTLGGVYLGTSQRRNRTLNFRTMSTQAWQMEKIPSNIHVDLTNLELQQLPGTLKQASDVRIFKGSWFTQRFTDTKTKFIMSRLSTEITVCLPSVYQVCSMFAQICTRFTQFSPITFPQKTYG